MAAILYKRYGTESFFSIRSCFSENPDCGPGTSESCNGHHEMNWGIDWNIPSTKLICARLQGDMDGAYAATIDLCTPLQIDVGDPGAGCSCAVFSTRFKHKDLCTATQMPHPYAFLHTCAPQRCWHVYTRMHTHIRSRHEASLLRGRQHMACMPTPV